MYATLDARRHGEPQHDAEREFRLAVAEFVALVLRRALRGRTVAEATTALRAARAEIEGRSER